VELMFFAEFAVLFNLQLSLHINFIPFCNIILVLTDGTN